MLQPRSAYVQAQPAFADVNLVSSLAESSGPVEQLKGKFLGSQVRKSDSHLFLNKPASVSCQLGCVRFNAGCCFPEESSRRIHRQQHYRWLRRPRYLDLSLVAPCLQSRVLIVASNFSTLSQGETLSAVFLHQSSHCVQESVVRKMPQ